jgi:hypothetical protein
MHTARQCKSTIPHNFPANTKHQQQYDSVKYKRRSRICRLRQNTAADQSNAAGHLPLAKNRFQIARKSSDVQRIDQKYRINSSDK